MLGSYGAEDGGIPVEQVQELERALQDAGVDHDVTIYEGAAHAFEVECRLYDRLFTEAEPEKDGRDFKSVLNPKSLEVIRARCEPSLKDAVAEERYQFERLGYFALDLDSQPGTPVFNRTITLKDTWAKELKKA